MVHTSDVVIFILLCLGSHIEVVKAEVFFIVCWWGIMGIMCCLVWRVG